MQWSSCRSGSRPHEPHLPWGPAQSSGPHWEPWRAKDQAPSQTLAHAHTLLDGPLQQPDCSAGLRRCSAAIFWPHAALQPRLPCGWTQPEPQPPRAQATSLSCTPGGGPPLWAPVGRPLSLSHGPRLQTSPGSHNGALCPRRGTRYPGPKGPRAPWGCPLPDPMPGLVLGKAERERDHLRRPEGEGGVHASVCEVPKSQEPLLLEKGLWVISMFLLVCLPIYLLGCVYFFFFFMLNWNFTFFYNAQVSL